MTIQESINRTNNLVATALVGLAGFAFAPESFIETELNFKADDIALLLLGVGAIAWYRKGNNRFSRSVIPVIFVFAGLVIKVAAVIIEFNQKDDVGDDFGGLILFALGTLLVSWLYIKSKKLLA